LLLRLLFLFQFAFEILSLFPTAGLGAATDEGAIRSENAVDPLWAAAAFVVDVVGRAGRIVAGVNRDPGISTFAESIVRLLYDLFYNFVNLLISEVYSGGGGGSRTNHCVDST
jgi:hypothetical protein